MKRILPLFFFSMLTLCAQPQPKEIKLTLLETSDVHGNYLPYDFIKGNPDRAAWPAWPPT